MRLDRRLGHKGYTIFHIERCERMRDIAWVDDELNCWAEFVRPYRFDNGVCRFRTFKAKRILILTERRLVLINPVGMDYELDRQRGDVLVERERAAH